MATISFRKDLIIELPYLRRFAHGLCGAPQYLCEQLAAQSQAHRTSTICKASKGLGNQSKNRIFPWRCSLLAELVVGMQPTKMELCKLLIWCNAHLLPTKFFQWK
jgi:hypothetical protein